MRSGLGELGIRPDVAERCIGHQPANSIEKIYGRYSYRPEIAAALQRWSDHVMSIVEGRTSTVVPLRA
jgi:hypothetical protein